MSTICPGIPFRSSGDVAILIADDDADCLREINEFLTLLKFRVGTASTVNEAVARFEAEHFDLLLLDLEMPQMSGLAVAQSLFGDLFFHRAILMTGHYEKADVISGQFGESLHILRKPLQLTRLLNIIKMLSFEMTRGTDLPAPGFSEVRKNTQISIEYLAIRD